MIVPRIWLATTKVDLAFEEMVLAWSTLLSSIGLHLVSGYVRFGAPCDVDTSKKCGVGCWIYDLRIQRLGPIHDFKLKTQFSMETEQEAGDKIEKALDARTVLKARSKGDLKKRQQF